jgi:pimeloyl-ACP methyl ester carboxylesterase
MHTDDMHSLILLPGLACDAELFAGQLPTLVAQHDVTVSNVHTRCATLPQMATTLLAEHPGAHVFVGVSMGGMLLLELLRQAPQRVRAGALLGSTARPDTPELIKLRSQACELFAAGRMDEVLRANLPLSFHPDSASRRDLVADYLAMIRRAGADQLIAQNRAVMARVDSRPRLSAIACPLLVICGDADTITPPDQAAEIATAVPGARLKMVPRAGHMLTMEQPALVTSLLTDWLNLLSAS